jgi:uncharacterized glyoxalase superfamily protein PhnB
MTSIQPELWVENAREALAFYAAAFDATVLHLVGQGTRSSRSSASAMQPSGSPPPLRR